MQAPKQTVGIFEILSRGQFICSNSTDDAIRKLYTVLEDEETFNYLYEYFLNINFILEKGDEYFYFSRQEAKVDLERKLEQSFKWIDILDFLKTYDNSFGCGCRFSPSAILERLKLDAELKNKLEAFRKHNNSKNTHTEIIEDIILKPLEKDKFIEVENIITHQYIVLTAFNYLEQLVATITITDEETK